ncbi:MAG: oleate hydratase [Micromonosporaceae bacterium]|nr:oleate hydratase [Micromonosporaceae bacterium]
MATPHSGQHLWIVGGGIAGMAAAAFAIRDANIPGANIHILEELGLSGGSMDGAPSPTVPDAYVTRGGRMFEERAYQCVWNLFSTIPSLEDPTRSVRQEMLEFNGKVKTYAKARLIDANHQILDSCDYGFSLRDRLEMTRLIATPESVLGSRRIDEVFGEHFFTTNFWRCWRTTFAFQTWHSAAEMRRYCLRFLHVFENLGNLSDVRRSVYNQYDSMIVPLQRWLLEQGVDVRFATRVTDVDFVDNGAAGRRATALHLETAEGTSLLPLGPNDHAIITIGSITADATYGNETVVPELIRGRADHGWSLWEQIAKKAPDFGRPMAFYGNIDEHKWESFTLTMHGETLLNRIIEYTGNTPGTGALMTWIESGWHLSVVVPHQPHFPNMPKDTYTLWGYGFEIDNRGDYVPKRMSEATGREILTEMIHQLGFEDILDEVLATTDVTTVMMPYASALFACRKPGDRPKVVPDRSQNFAFLGQFTELPEDIVFTVEYSIHGAMHAVYTLLGVNRSCPPIYHGIVDPKASFSATKTMLTR